MKNLKISSEASKFVKSRGIVDILAEIDAAISSIKGAQFVLTYSQSPESFEDWLLVTAVESSIPDKVLNNRLLHAVADVSAKASEYNVNLVSVVELKKNGKSSKEP